MHFLLMGIGWWQIHRARGALVTSGIYRYVRHPQYLGLFMIILGIKYDAIIVGASFAGILFFGLLFNTGSTGLALGGQTRSKQIQSK